MAACQAGRRNLPPPRMIRQAKELFQKALILAGTTIGGGIIGFFTPLFFDRDVGGAMAAGLLGIVGVMPGWVYCPAQLRLSC
jgi:hypothetical protein